MSQNPEGSPGSEAGGESLDAEIERVRAGGQSDRFVVNLLAARDPSEPGVLTGIVNEMSESFEHHEWMMAAVDEAGLMFERKLNEEGELIGLRIVPKPPTIPQSPVDMV